VSAVFDQHSAAGDAPAAKLRAAAMRSRRDLNALTADALPCMRAALVESET
jgi:hypothetical protein